MYKLSPGRFWTAWLPRAQSSWMRTVTLGGGGEGGRGKNKLDQ